MSYARMRRFSGIAVGVVTHVLFVVTVWHLFWFLKGPEPATQTGPMWINGLLALQFAVVHSLILLPTTRRRLNDWIPTEFYGCFFCMATCLSLLLTFSGWQTSSIVLWRFEGWSRTFVQGAYLASWVALVYALSLTGLGYQTGLSQWLTWLRGEKLPRRKFAPRGVYHWMRHPVYLAFLGLVWFTPAMTLDRATLTAVWTAYILVGSRLKDIRLEFYLGDAYRAYQSRVPGYPLMPFGPLGRIARTTMPSFPGTIVSENPVTCENKAA
jgi:protein-S-isoprenylcysteine O-methyltransferase Ste14